MSARNGPDRGRRAIYYWKCDRPSAFDHVTPRNSPGEILSLLGKWLEPTFPGHALAPAGGQGNHKTFLLHHDETTHFVRMEDSLDGDGHLAVESSVLQQVAQSGVRVPEVRLVDASRKKLPFAVQVIEHFPIPDLNTWHKMGGLDLLGVARQIGEAIGHWQRTPISNFGHFQPEAATGKPARLVGFYDDYVSYFHLNLETHLGILRDGGFLSLRETHDIGHLIDRHEGLLRLTTRPTLVHKDLALWNILGEPNRCHVFIDWDDAVGGDPLDDLSLIACFHPGPVVEMTLEGYRTVAALPQEHEARFWLHLLRNMIVKSVIRLKGGYFDRNDTFFLIPHGESGSNFRVTTRERLMKAADGLRHGKKISSL